MIKCEVCGAELPDGTKECPKCKVWLVPPESTDEEVA